MRLATQAMGTRFELVVLGDDETSLRAIGEQAIERIEAAHRSFTRFDESSLLAHLRRTAPDLTEVDSDEFALFSEALDVTRQSGRSFDPSLGRAGFDALVRLEPATRRVGVANPAARFDFGAIAKGHAVELAVTVLRDGGVRAGFVHGGTSSGFGFGAPGPSSGWRVSLGPGRWDPVLELRDQGFSVSGVWSERDGHRTPHTINPGTGRALRADRRVAVVGPSPRLADAWSTAILVSGCRPAALGGEWRVWQSDARHQWTPLDG